MTAIVGTLNRKGIAFAADSAATLTLSDKSKISNNANKLFALSKKYPVGIALYNNLDFHGIPWEIIIKMYRNNYLKDRSFLQLSEYIEDFWSYIKSEILPKVEPSQESHVSFMASNLESEILSLSNKNLEDRGEAVDEAKQFAEMDAILKGLVLDFSKHERAQGYEDYMYDDFVAYSEKLIETEISALLGNAFCPADFKDTFAKALFWIMMSKQEVYFNYSGLVFWGYGEEDLFPSCYDYHITLAFDKRMKTVEQAAYHVSNDSHAWIVPFAQTDVANTVVGGIDHTLRKAIYKGIEGAFDDFRNNIIAELNKAGAPKDLSDALTNFVS